MSTQYHASIEGQNRNNDDRDVQKLKIKKATRDIRMLVTK